MGPICLRYAGENTAHIYLGRNNVPFVEDSGIWLDAEDSWLDHTIWVLADLVVEVLILGTWSAGDDRLNVALLGHVVAKLVRHIRITLCEVKSSEKYPYYPSQVPSLYRECVTCTKVISKRSHNVQK